MKKGGDPRRVLSVFEESFLQIHGRKKGTAIVRNYHDYIKNKEVITFSLFTI